VASAATALGFLGRFWWFFDLFSHFRVQYLLGLLVLSALLWVARRRAIAMGFLGFAGVNLLTVLPLYLPPSSNPHNAWPLRVMLLNVNTERGDPARVMNEMSAVDPDLVILEEIDKNWTDKLAATTSAYPYSVTRPRNDNFGIALYSKHPIVKSALVLNDEARIPSIVATVDTPSGYLQVIATHPLPPVGAEQSRLRNHQLAQLPTHIKPDIPTILIGDLNTTPWNYYFRRLLAESGLRDSAQGFGVQPTWPDLIWPLRLPIDHCLHSSDVIIQDRWIGAPVGSDHYPLLVDLGLPRPE